jgi:hypothetical protein
MDTTTTTAIIITAAVTLLICVIAFKVFRFICRIFSGKKSSKVDKVFKDIELLADAVADGEVKIGPEVRAILKDIYKRAEKFDVYISDEADSDYFSELLEPLERLASRK